MIRGIVFDIDDTLYLERDYVRSGFAHVAREVGRTDDEAGRLHDWLIRAFESGVRGDTFDRLRAAHPRLESAYRQPFYNQSRRFGNYRRPCAARPVRGAFVMYRLSRQVVFWLEAASSW